MPVFKYEDDVCTWWYSHIWLIENTSVIDIDIDVPVLVGHDLLQAVWDKLAYQLQQFNMALYLCLVLLSYFKTLNVDITVRCKNKNKKDNNKTC